jgi:hypothetical protein
MPIYLGPRVIESSLYTLDNNVKQHAITTLINGMEVAVLEHHLQDTVKEMKNLSVAFNTFKKDMEHSLMQHLLSELKYSAYCWFSRGSVDGLRLREVRGRWKSLTKSSRV